MPSIVVVVGNPQPHSRTRLVAEEVARQLAERAGRAASVEETIELADVAGELFAVPSDEVDALLARVAAADVAVIASPTYKATYTGLLKAFLDRYGADALASVTAVPVLTIGAPTHALAVELALRPLLVELGASVPTRGIAFPAGAVEDRARIVGEWADAAWPRIRHALVAPAAV